MTTIQIRTYDSYMGLLDSFLGLFGGGGGQAKEEPAAEAPAEVEEAAEELPTE